MKKKLAVAFVALAFLSGLGVVGSMDYEDAVKSEAHICKMINKGSWGAGKEQRERCKLIMEKSKNGY